MYDNFLLDVRANVGLQANGFQSSCQYEKIKFDEYDSPGNLEDSEYVIFCLVAPGIVRELLCLCAYVYIDAGRKAVRALNPTGVKKNENAVETCRHYQQSW